MASTASAGPRMLRPSQEVKHAADLTRRLRDEAVFAGVTIRQDVDLSGRLRVDGAVGSAADIDVLKSRLADMDQRAEFVVEVKVGQGLGNGK